MILVIILLNQLLFRAIICCNCLMPLIMFSLLIGLLAHILISIFLHVSRHRIE